MERDRAIGVGIEHGMGGRWLEQYDEVGGVMDEIGAGGLAFIPRGLPQESNTIGKAKIVIFAASGELWS